MFDFETSKKRNLIICGDCEEEGKMSVLGEILENGDVLVKRATTDRNGATIIKSPSLSLVCSLCLGTAFIRNNGTVSYPNAYFTHIERSTLVVIGTP